MNESIVVAPPLQYHVLKDRSNSTIEKETLKESTYPRVPKPRSRSSVSTVVNRQKLKQQLEQSHMHAKPLNTHSPVAIAAANAVTSEKIYEHLKKEGPLPIRNITAHLANSITGFGELSLSKQRRLIISVLEAPRSQFEKVGWGRWAIKANVKTERSGTLTGDTTKHQARRSYRESVSNTLPSSKPPLSPSLVPVSDSAIMSESDSDSEIENTDEEDWQSLGPSKLREASPREKEAIAALVQLHSN